MSPASPSFDVWKSAVEKGDAKIVRALFQAHPELAKQVNENVFPFNSSAIFHSRENLEMLDLLIEYGADINQKTGWWAGGFGILEGVQMSVAEPLIKRGVKLDIWSAVSLNQIDKVANLLADDRQLVCAPGGDGKHPLHYADTVKMVDLLVQAGADVNARDIDHTSTPTQYLIKNIPVVKRLLHHGAEPDIFLGAALGNLELIRDCVTLDPGCVNDRLGVGKWKNDAGGFIYNWTLDHDATPLDVARKRGHESALDFMLSKCSPHRQLTDALWNSDPERVDSILDQHPNLMGELELDDRQMLARAAWCYRPSAVRLMLERGFDPHVAGVHDSTPLDRAAFHGYADIVKLLLEHDPNPPLNRKNEFSGRPLEACVHGFLHGWKTSHPQDHHGTAKALLDAGAVISKQQKPTGDQKIDSLLGLQ